MVKLLGSSTLLDNNYNTICNFFKSILGSDYAIYTETSAYTAYGVYDKDKQVIFSMTTWRVGNNIIKLCDKVEFAFMDNASSYSAIKYQINVFKTNNGYIFQFNMLKGNNDWITYELCYNENTKFAFCTKAFFVTLATGDSKSLGYIIANATSSDATKTLTIQGLSSPSVSSKVPILQEIPSPSNGSTGIYVNVGGPFRRCSVEANGKTYFIDIIGALED